MSKLYYSGEQATWKKHYPFKSNFFQLKVGHKLHFLDEGDKSKPVLLLLHGNPTWSFYYRNLIKHFALKYRVIALDHLGMGLSDKLGTPVLFKERIQHVKELLDFLNIQELSILGHDWGGAIACGVAQIQGLKIEKLILMNTCAYTSNWIPKRIAICKIPWVGEFLTVYLNLFLKGLLKMGVQRNLNIEEVQGYLYPYANIKDRKAIHQFIEDIPLKENHRSYSTLKEVEQNLNQIECPKLLIWGGSDFCFDKRFYEKFKQIFPKAYSLFFPWANHLVLEDAWDELCKPLTQFMQTGDLG